MASISYSYPYPSPFRDPCTDCRDRPVTRATRVTRWLERLEVWQRRSSGRRELTKLSDHMLKDIGISRADAWHEAKKPFWQA